MLVGLEHSGFECAALRVHQIYSERIYQLT